MRTASKYRSRVAGSSRFCLAEARRRYLQSRSRKPALATSSPKKTATWTITLSLRTIESRLIKSNVCHYVHRVALDKNYKEVRFDITLRRSTLTEFTFIIRSLKLLNFTKFQLLAFSALLRFSTRRRSILPHQNTSHTAIPPRQYPLTQNTISKPIPPTAISNTSTPQSTLLNQDGGNC
jgi:hypothetical protein